jgi:hypothetical protein
MRLFLSKLTLLVIVVSFAGLPKAYSIELPTDNWNLNIFSYVNGHLAHSGNYEPDDYLELGESSIFVFGRLSNRLSILTEVSLLPKKYREDTVKVERLTLRWDLNEKHRLTLGKMHTPVNYWNDSFHHGRYFFPTIDRPLAFQKFVPVHEIGLRFSGSRLGKYNFFYDVVIGSGQSAGDHAFSHGLKSTTLAIGIRPTENLEIRSSLYQDEIINHQNDPKHRFGDQTNGSEDLDWQLWSGSVYFENDKIQLLTELSASKNKGGNLNYTSSIFAGWKWLPRLMPFVFVDFERVDPKETHFSPGIQRRYGAGIKTAVSNRTDLKVDLSTHDLSGDESKPSYTALRFQFSVGF